MRVLAQSNAVVALVQTFSERQFVIYVLKPAEHTWKASLEKPFTGMLHNRLPSGRCGKRAWEATRLSNFDVFGSLRVAINRRKSRAHWKNVLAPAKNRGPQ